MTPKLESFRVTFDPKRYSQNTLVLILNKAEEWKCSPLEAEARLLEQLAEREEEKGAA